MKSQKDDRPRTGPTTLPSPPPDPPWRPLNTRRTVVRSGPFLPKLKASPIAFLSLAPSYHVKSGTRVSAPGSGAGRSFAAEIDGRLRGAGKQGAAGFRQPADQPVRLQRVGEPGFCPAGLKAAPDQCCVDPLALFVEQRQLAPGLGKAPPQPPDLSFGRLALRHAASVP